VEDLCVAGLGRTRLAKSVHDTGWATLVRLLEDKAAQHRRRVVKIGRWEPTSQLCSACRHRDGPKPLGIRAWACPACGVAQDRDANAARNILVAAGLAETQTPVEAVTAQSNPWPWPAKQEPAEAPERRGRNPRSSRRGGGQHAARLVR
jgi:putative transposase